MYKFCKKNITVNVPSYNDTLYVWLQLTYHINTTFFNIIKSVYAT